jgi:hypothetical protein
MQKRASFPSFSSKLGAMVAPVHLDSSPLVQCFSAALIYSLLDSVSYSANKNPGQWKPHGRYVARESATQGGKAREAGFNAVEQNLNIAAKLDKWQGTGDERLFKIIASPEFGDRLNLHPYARELMHQMEHDLGVHLEWVAAVHHNTEHPHVHIALPGVDKKGIPLRLPREYIRWGLRERASITEDN